MIPFNGQSLFSGLFNGYGSSPLNRDTTVLSSSQNVRLSGYQVQVIYCTFSNALIQVFTKDLLQQYFLMHFIGVFLFYFMKKKILCEHFPFNLTLRKRKQSLVPKDLLVQWLADFLLKNFFFQTPFNSIHWSWWLRLEVEVSDVFAPAILSLLCDKYWRL